MIAMTKNIFKQHHIKEADAKCVEMMFFFLNLNPSLQTNAITGLGGIKHDMKKSRKNQMETQLKRPELISLCLKQYIHKMGLLSFIFSLCPKIKNQNKTGSKRFLLKQEEVLSSLGTIFPGGLIHTLWLREHLEKQDSISKNDTNEDIEKT